VVTNKFNAGADLSFIGRQNRPPFPALAAAARRGPWMTRVQVPTGCVQPGAHHLGVTISPGRNSLELVLGTPSRVSRISRATWFG